MTSFYSRITAFTYVAGILHEIDGYSTVILGWPNNVLN